MNQTVIAIPSEDEDGINSKISPHFGHCGIYTIVTIESGKIKNIASLPNVYHEQGGCLAPVAHLADNGINILIAGGMGMRPLMHFQNTDIDVYYNMNLSTVSEAIDAFLEDKLPKFSQDFACGGGNH